MKKQFMVEFKLPGFFNPEFLKLLPAQRKMVNSLFAKGILKSYSLAMDRSVLWSIFVAESEFEIREIISKFPLADFLEPYISELMFHNNETQVMQFSLN